MAFGLRGGPAPDRFLVGLAVLGLFSAAAGTHPVLCVVDDAQWLDRVSAQTLGFVARRLLAEPVAVVFAQREDTAELAGLPKLPVGGLADADARMLLEAAILGRIDDRVPDRVRFRHPLVRSAVYRSAGLDARRAGAGRRHRLRRRPRPACLAPRTRRQVLTSPWPLN